MKHAIPIHEAFNEQATKALALVGYTTLRFSLAGTHRWYLSGGSTRFSPPADTLAELLAALGAPGRPTLREAPYLAEEAEHLAEEAEHDRYRRLEAKGWARDGCEGWWLAE